jgi:hypothetical protein
VGDVVDGEVGGLQEFLGPADADGGDPLHGCPAGLLVEPTVEGACTEPGVSRDAGQAQVLVGVGFQPLEDRVEAESVVGVRVGAHDELRLTAVAVQRCDGQP